MNRKELYITAQAASIFIFAILFCRTKDIDYFLSFVSGVAIVVWFIPLVVSYILGVKETVNHDGEFIIDETDITDVKMKMVMNTAPEDLIFKEYATLKINYTPPRDENQDYDRKEC